MITVGHAEAEQRALRTALDAGVTEPQAASWLYASPALLLGRGQKPSVRVLERADREQLAVVTRASGGGAVLAGPWMLSVTLLVPAAHALARASLPASYRLVGEACRRALDRLNMPTRLVAGAAAPGHAPDSERLAWACFAGVSHGELVAADGRKIVGIAQVRRRDVIAVCIGVLLRRPDWETLLRVWQGREEPRLLQEIDDRTTSCDRLAPPASVPAAPALAASLSADLPALCQAA